MADFHPRLVAQWQPIISLLQQEVDGDAARLLHEVSSEQLIELVELVHGLDLPGAFRHLEDSQHRDYVAMLAMHGLVKLLADKLLADGRHDQN